MKAAGRTNRVVVEDILFKLNAPAIVTPSPQIFHDMPILITYFYDRETFLEEGGGF